jgi:hypothetical protein
MGTDSTDDRIKAAKPGSTLAEDGAGDDQSAGILFEPGLCRKGDKSQRVATLG